ncbi:uncharacterized protein LOC130995885 isoform X1 [Salvia miltiorrhiza]|uniref:uncharacterized protein LOC130995885 isoform X1 n=1 Tax=Salvia miltiorrhiza TaxID=226208 RepID=UPI0025ACFB7B|nr:uncharacterized protein LOC130995885 isoform X1 [Salvia miltiorrhiza]
MENKDVSEELADWQQVDGEGNSSVVKDDFFAKSSVFPPGNHEDLPITNQGDEHEQLQLQLQGPVHTPPPAASGGDGVRKWMRLHVGALQTGILWIFGRLRYCVTCRVGVWSFAWIAGGVAAAAAALLLSLWQGRLLMWWQRRLRIDSSKKRLMAVIDEKDKKINQLLLQIAQTNEMLLARRRVPVIRLK